MNSGCDSPEDKDRKGNLLERLGGGVLCREGFLGADPRPLAEILADDQAAVERCGTTHEELARRLKAICQAAREAFGAEVAVKSGKGVEGGLKAIHREAMGHIPCPWGDGERFPKGEVELLCTATGQRLLLTPLSIHLIERHGFYQGRGSRYRIDPAAACRLVGLDGGREDRR